MKILNNKHSKTRKLSNLYRNTAFLILFTVCFQLAWGQRKDNTPTRKPVLTNKYRLKKRVTPPEGIQSKGSEKIPKQQTVQAGYYAGEKRYVEAPQTMGYDKFKSKTPLLTRALQKRSATFKSKYKFLPHQYRRGYDEFVSKTKFLPHTYRRGYDEFVSKTKFLPHKYRKGHDKFTGNKISYNFLAQRHKTILYNTRQQQSYSGTIRYVDWKAIRLRRSYRMAHSLGAMKIPYSLRPSRLSNRELQKYYSKPYNVRYLRKGKFMWKKNMPHFQRYPEKSPRYNPTEKQGATVSSGRGELLYPNRGTIWMGGVPQKRMIIGTPTATPLPLNAPSRAKELKQMQKEQKNNRNLQEPKQD